MMLLSSPIESDPVMTRYRGRHRAPSLTDTIADNSTRIAAAVMTTGVLSSVPVVVASPASAAIDPDSVRDAIISCESGGENIENPGESTASGFYQFTDGTWRRFGGTEFASRAIGATRAEQDVVFNRAIAANGTKDWEADPRSENCWRPKIGQAKRSNGNEAPQSDTGKRRAAAVDSRNPDGTGQYTCDEAHLYFEACDADNLGEVVNYPAYSSGKRAAPEGSRGSYTCDNEHLYFEACDPDNLGETVAYPERRS